MRERAFQFFGLNLSKLELHSEADGGRTLVGYASAFDVPMPGDQGETVIVRPNAFTKTLKENRDTIQVLYAHGRDPQIGEKPLGRPRTIDQDKTGLWTETPLAKTTYNEEIVIPLLASGAIRGMSVSIGIMQQSWSDDHSTRYIEQVYLDEFGPTPRPRNLGATAALHSLSLDEFAPILDPIQSESSDSGDRSTDEAAASPDPDRLTWSLNASRKLEVYDEDLAAMAARLAKLKE